MKLKNEDIPLGARIICVCDAFETMLFGRGRVKKKSFYDAICSIQKGVNLKFDPVVVNALFSALKEHPETISEQGAIEKYKERLCMDLDALGLSNPDPEKMGFRFNDLFLETY